MWIAESGKTNIILPNQLPIKQGLKQSIASLPPYGGSTSKSTSNKTRIETQPCKSIAGQLDNLPNQLPIKQGLKQGIEELNRGDTIFFQINFQ